MKKWLAGALFISLSLNAALLWFITHTRPSAELTELTLTSSAKKPTAVPFASAPSSAAEYSRPTSASVSPIPHLRQLFADNNPDFYPALSAALRAEPENWELLMLEAEWIKQEKPLSDAIIHYYGLLERNPPAQLAKEIRGIIPPLIDNAVDKLRLAGEWDTLAQFIEPLFQFAPQNRTFIMQLAEAYGRQNKMTLMENVLASVLPDDPQAEAIRASVYKNLASQQPNNDEALSRRAAVSEHAFVMDLEQTGDHYLAPIRLNGRYSRLLVDTGASITTITADVFAQLRHRGNYRDLGKFTLNTAGGQVEARMITLEKVEFGPFTLSDLALMVLPEDTLIGAEGLLGMNILKRFDFRIDQYQSALLLDPIH